MIRFTICGAIAFPLFLYPQTLPQLPLSGCPMAHCDPHLNDAVGLTAPPTGQSIQIDTLSGGAGIGLGCSSNGTIFACSFGSVGGSNLIVYDADGNRIYAAPPALLNQNARKSAPIVFTDGMVLAADNLHLLLINPQTATVQWMTTKPDTSSTISPVLVGGSIVLLATQGLGAISTYDLATGALLSTFYISSPLCGNFDTENTPAVNLQRVYIVSACIADLSQGGLAAVDVVANGPTRGVMSQAWLYQFVGPSGASPLFTNGTVFFDGLASAGSAQGTFMAVHDTLNGPILLWQQTFGSHFAANAGQDPRGGIWIFPTGQPNLYRLSNTSGSFLQTFAVPVPAGQTGPYLPSSAVSLSKAANNDIILTFGGVSSTHTGPAIVATEDISTGTNAWYYEIGGPAGNMTAAQFPIATDAAGLTRIAFPGSLAGTYFVGQPAH